MHIVYIALGTLSICIPLVLTFIHIFVVTPVAIEPPVLCMAWLIGLCAAILCYTRAEILWRLVHEFTPLNDEATERDKT